MFQVQNKNQQITFKDLLLFAKFFNSTLTPINEIGDRNSKRIDVAAVQDQVRNFRAGKIKINGEMIFDFNNVDCEYYIELFNIYKKHFHYEKMADFFAANLNQDFFSTSRTRIVLDLLLESDNINITNLQPMSLNISACSYNDEKKEESCFLMITEEVYGSKNEGEEKLLGELNIEVEFKCSQNTTCFLCVKKFEFSDNEGNLISNKLTGEVPKNYLQENQWWWSGLFKHEHKRSEVLNLLQTKLEEFVSNDKLTFAYKDIPSAQEINKFEQLKAQVDKCRRELMDLMHKIKVSHLSDKYNQQLEEYNKVLQEFDDELKKYPERPYFMQFDSKQYGEFYKGMVSKFAKEIAELEPKLQEIQQQIDANIEQRKAIFEVNAAKNKLSLYQKLIDGYLATGIMSHNEGMDNVAKLEVPGDFNEVTASKYSDAVNKIVEKKVGFIKKHQHEINEFIKNNEKSILRFIGKNRKYFGNKVKKYNTLEKLWFFDGDFKSEQFELFNCYVWLSEISNIFETNFVYKFWEHNFADCDFFVHGDRLLDFDSLFDKYINTNSTENNLNLQVLKKLLEGILASLDEMHRKLEERGYQEKVAEESNSKSKETLIEEFCNQIDKEITKKSFTSYYDESVFKNPTFVINFLESIENPCAMLSKNNKIKVKVHYYPQLKLLFTDWGELYNYCTKSDRAWLKAYLKIDENYQFTIIKKELAKELANEISNNRRVVSKDFNLADNKKIKFLLEKQPDISDKVKKLSERIKNDAFKNIPRIEFLVKKIVTFAEMVNDIGIWQRAHAILRKIEKLTAPKDAYNTEIDSKSSAVNIYLTYICELEKWHRLLEKKQDIEKAIEETTSKYRQFFVFIKKYGLDLPEAYRGIINNWKESYKFWFNRKIINKENFYANLINHKKSFMQIKKKDFENAAIEQTLKNEDKDKLSKKSKFVKLLKTKKDNLFTNAEKELTEKCATVISKYDARQTKIRKGWLIFFIALAAIFLIVIFAGIALPFIVGAVICYCYRLNKRSNKIVPETVDEGEQRAPAMREHEKRGCEKKKWQCPCLFFRIFCPCMSFNAQKLNSDLKKNLMSK